MLLNSLLHRLFLNHDIIFLFLDHIEKKIKFLILLKTLWKMEHLLQKSKHSNFHNIFIYIIFQRDQRISYEVNGLLLAPWTIFHDFFSRQLIFSNQLFHFFIGIPSECQTDWIQIRPDILLGIILVQSVCKVYQQTTLEL